MAKGSNGLMKQGYYYWNGFFVRLVVGVRRFWIPIHRITPYIHKDANSRQFEKKTLGCRQ
jgi:hypothetical protein